MPDTLSADEVRQLTGNTSTTSPMGGPAPSNPSIFSQVGTGALDFINNNPVSKSLTSLSALPVQLLAKGLGQPDPYAGGIGAHGGPLPTAQVTSSDQPAGQWAASELGNAATAGSLFLPVGDIAAGAGAGLAKFAPQALKPAAGFLGRVGAQATFGGGLGAAGALQNGQTDPGTIANAAGIGAITGGGLATAGELGSALVNSFASATSEGRLTSQKNGLKTLTNAFNDNSTAETNPIKTFEENGFTSKLKVDNGRINVDGLTNQARTGAIDQSIGEIQDKATELVKNMPGGVDTTQFQNDVVEAIKQNPAIRDAGNVSRALADVQRRFADYRSSFGNTVPFQAINGVKVAMNKVWNPEEVDVARTVGDVARGYLYNTGGSSDVVAAQGGKELQSLMQNEAELIKARNFAEKLNGTVVRGGKLGKYFAQSAGLTVGGGIGGGIGSFFGPAGIAVGAPAGAAMGEELMRHGVNAAQSNYFNPLFSSSARNFQSLLQSPAAGLVSRTTKGMLIPSLVGNQPKQ